MFLFKSHPQNVVKKLFPDPSLKNQNWACLWINSLIDIAKLRNIDINIQYILLKLNSRQLAFTSYKAFLKTKRSLELVSLPHFLPDFWRKLFLLLYSITWPIFFVWLHLLREILDKYVYSNCFFNQVVTS